MLAIIATLIALAIGAYLFMGTSGTKKAAVATKKAAPTPASSSLPPSAQEPLIKQKAPVATKKAAPTESMAKKGVQTEQEPLLPTATPEPTPKRAPATEQAAP